MRLWRTARTQAEILAHMRDASGLENHPDLAAYWKFNDPEEEVRALCTQRRAHSSRVSGSCRVQCAPLHAVACWCRCCCGSQKL